MNLAIVKYLNVIFLMTCGFFNINDMCGYQNNIHFIYEIYIAKKGNHYLKRHLVFQPIKKYDNDNGEITIKEKIVTVKFKAKIEFK